MRSLSIGATGMLAQQMNVEVISNNIANLSTTGFKRQRAEFQDLMYENIRRPGTSSSDAGTIVPSGIQLGAGVKPVAVYRINEQGALSFTENPLDLAVNGRGYFQVQRPDGSTSYTRAGSLQTNADGTIVTADGFPITPQIAIPAGALDITITADGLVQVKINGQIAPTQAGQIQLAVFPNPGGLEAIGDNQFIETAASGAPVVSNPNVDGVGSLQQGALETANVNIVEEISRLITAQRAYEMNSRVIRTSDDMMSALTQLR